MKRRQELLIFVYLAAFFVVNLLLLEKFPFMHSDESWLSGLTRAMMSRGPGVTEPFFDLMPRFPHAIKILFHGIQMPFILAFGYNLFAVRLVSLLFGTALLYVFYRLCSLLFQGTIKPLVMTMILSVDVQFIYASHMARQDIIIAFGIVAVLYFVMSGIDRWSYKKDVIAGVLTGVFVGIHPNSLMVALAAGGLYLYYVFAKKLKVRNLLVLVGVVAACAGVFVAISYSFDSQFLPHYMKFGSTLGVDMSLIEKVQYLPSYFEKLFLGVSGTYYTPPVGMQLTLFGAAVIGGAVAVIRKRGVLRILVPLICVVAGIVFIGRYSQPAVILLFPLCWLLVFYLVDMLPKVLKTVCLGLVGAAVLAVSLFTIAADIDNDYEEYISHVESSVPKGVVVLANLNTEYAFSEGTMHDVRNLQFLEDKEMSFEKYVRSRGVEYIVYPQEMDFIAERRPVWNIIYGNVIPYYDDMKRFLNEECSVVSEFTSPYAMRIVQYSDKQEWTVTVYRVED